MTSTASKVDTIRVIRFSGSKEGWPVWEEKFLARARRSGYKEVLKGTMYIPIASDVIDEATDEGKRELKARNANDYAFEDLILSINGETRVGRVAFGIVKGCKTRELPDGDAHLAWTRLSNKFE